LEFRSNPKDRILLEEVQVLVKNGHRGICLHSEDALFYGRAGWEALT